MVTQWKDDWAHANFKPTHVAISRLFLNDELKALVQFHGNSQRHFYSVTRFENGSSAEVPGEFATLDEAKAAA